MIPTTIKRHSGLISEALNNYPDIRRIIPERFYTLSPHFFDFSDKNQELNTIDFNNIDQFSAYIGNTIIKNGCEYGYGGYGENRVIYQHSNLFKGKSEPRSVHLGVDIWLPANTPIYSPLQAIVHSFHDNNNFGDYGPTIILQHSLKGINFYTLFGHLSRLSLLTLKVGVKINAGQQIATTGDNNENGHWPTHLHFQIISNLLGKNGDFPGVSSVSEQNYYLALCPNPNLILRGILNK